VGSSRNLALKRHNSNRLIRLEYATPSYCEGGEVADGSRRVVEVNEDLIFLFMHQK
jgi:hypothetical protein